jgi:hypothetical protein
MISHQQSADGQAESAQLRCPVCKADNASGPACRRCKADLSMLFALEEQRAIHLSQAKGAFAEGRFDDALRHAIDADALRHGPDSRHWLAIMHLLAENFGEVWSAYQSTNEHD